MLPPEQLLFACSCSEPLHIYCATDAVFTAAWAASFLLLRLQQHFRKRSHEYEAGRKAQASSVKRRGSGAHLSWELPFQLALRSCECKEFTARGRGGRGCSADGEMCDIQAAFTVHEPAGSCTGTSCTVDLLTCTHAGTHTYKRQIFHNSFSHLQFAPQDIMGFMKVSLIHIKLSVITFPFVLVIDTVLHIWKNHEQQEQNLFTSCGAAPKEEVRY